MSLDQTKPSPDMSCWEVEVVKRDEFEFKAWPRTRSGVIAQVNKITTWFPEPDYVRITFYSDGPFVVLSKEEENHLSCWHYEPEEETFGYMLKWAVGTTIAYKFVDQGELALQICELVNSGVTKIHLNHHHGQVEPGDPQFAL